MSSLWPTRLERQKSPEQNTLSTALAEKGCLACPLNNADLISPKMEADGDSAPDIYFLGEAPGRVEDEQGRPFSGESGGILRNKIERADNHPLPVPLRFYNTLKCRVQGKPTEIQLDCCRNYIVEDIERAKPKLIVAVGGTALDWLLETTGNSIDRWRGRDFPVQVGSHTCWAYAIGHPARILHERNNYQTAMQLEDVLEHDMERIFRVILDRDPPRIVTVADLAKNLHIQTGQLHSAFRDVISVDIETHPLRPYASNAELISVSISDADKTIAFSWNTNHKDWLKELLMSRKLVICHNTSFEAEWFAQFLGPEIVHGVTWADTMLAGYVLDERARSHSLDFMFRQYGGIWLKSIFDLDRGRLNEYPLEDVLRYNAYDTRATFILWRLVLQRLREENLLSTYREHASRIPALTFAQRIGVQVDLDKNEELQGHYQGVLKRIDSVVQNTPSGERFLSRFGHRVALSSAKDVTDMLTHVVGVEGLKSTEKEALEKLDIPFAKDVLRYRSAEKMLSTYVKPYGTVEGVLWPDGKLHCSFNQTFTRTGRLSCNDPNLMNLPVRDAETKIIRMQIYVMGDWVLIAVDYKQLEVCTVAILSGDQVLLRHLEEGADIHGEWTERLADVRKGDESVSKMRSDIKNGFTFPLVYGAADKTVALHLKIDIEIAKRWCYDFRHEYHRIFEWHKELHAQYAKYGYITCLNGRRRHSPMSMNMVINTPVQGTASDIVMDAMVRLSAKAWAEKKRQLQPLINVHDELLFACPRNKLDETLRDIGDMMVKELPDWVTAPMAVEFEVGQNWGEMEFHSEVSSLVN